jgi:hypothetical protein
MPFIQANMYDLIVIKHRNTTSSFNSWSAERNGENINVTVRTTIREEL